LVIARSQKDFFYYAAKTAFPRAAHVCL
jgi:hypothetical protein